MSEGPLVDVEGMKRGHWNHCAIVVAGALVLSIGSSPEPGTLPGLVHVSGAHVWRLLLGQCGLTLHLVMPVTGTKCLLVNTR